MRRTYRWDPEQNKLVEVTPSKHHGVRAPAYLGDRTLEARARDRGMVPVEEFPRIHEDWKRGRYDEAKREKRDRAHRIADVVNQKGYRF